MRILSTFLIICLLFPLFPNKAAAQLLLNPVDVPANIPQAVSAHSAQNPSSGSSSSPLSSYIPQGIIPPDYKLGPGDQLEAHLIVGDNALALDYSFIVNPEGKIFFPNVGEISLTGLTMGQAKTEISQKIRRKYRERFSLSLMISMPKLVKIYITGQVLRPGLHSIYDGSKISDVIKAVGSAPGGSQRNVTIKRKDEIINIDLYKILYQGDIASDISIRMGDIIEVPAFGSSRVTIMGEVPRPGTYELKEGERLKDALAMAGYVGVNSALSEVAYLKRKKGEDDFENYKLNLYDMFLKNDDSQNIELTDGDIVSIPGIKAYVYIYGEVKNGGRFEYFPGNKLSDYINISGGPLAQANLGAVSVTRQENNKPKIYKVNASQIIHKGKKDNDIEIMAGDVISVPRNFFYVNDFVSLVNTVFLAVSLYNIAKKF